jgi:hypothetical protein
MFHIRLHCGACGNRITVNLEGFTAKRAQEVDAVMRGQQCALCQANKLTGHVHPGFSATAQAVVRDEPVTWSPEAIREMLARRRGGGA